MQHIGSSILVMLVTQGVRQRRGALRTLRETWRGFRLGGIGGGLIGFVSAVAGIGPSASDLAIALENFRTDPTSDPLLRDILDRLRRQDGVADAVGDETLAMLSRNTGVSREAIVARLARSLPAVADATGKDSSADP